MKFCFCNVVLCNVCIYTQYLNILPWRTRSRKVLRVSSDSELRTERDKQEVSAVRAVRPADSIFSLDV